MTILISDNSPRISYTATAGQTVFTVPFEFFDNSDLNVYINDILKTITTDYTVTGGDGSTGTVTLVTGATVGDSIVITRDVTLERVTDFPTSGPFQVASLNVELDKLVAMVADLKDLANRGLRLSDSDLTASLTLASTDDRKGTVLAFNATTGAVEIGPTIADTNSVAQIKADIATVAGISSDVTTVAGISGNVTTVAGVSSDVTTVAGQTTNMQNITDNLSAVQNAATNATNAATSASNAASSETAAASSASSAATSETNAATSATNASNSASSASSSASTATTKASEAATSATNAATSETNAGASATAAASSASSASTSASNAATSATNASSSASSASSAQTAAEAARDSALAAFDNFDDKYLGEKASDPTLDNDGDALVTGALYFNTTDDVMKVYTGSAWVAAYVSGAGFLPTSGGTLTGDLSFGDNNKAIFGAGSDLQIYHDGGNSRIQDAGTGNLIIRGSAGTYIQGVNGENGVVVLENGATSLWYDAAQKLATTATGVAVTGVLDASSGVQVGGTNSYIYEGAANQLNFRIGADGPYAEMIDAGGGVMEFGNSGGALALTAAGTERARLTSSGLDVTGNVVSQVSINAQTGTTYTTVLADQSKLVTLNNASAITLTIPANSSVAYPIGTQIDLSQFGAGQVTVAGAGGVTVNSASGLKLKSQYSSASCIKVGTDTWLLVGDLEV